MVNVARQRLVARGRTIDRVPPTEAALLEHTRRAAYRAGHTWGNSIIPSPELPDTSIWGWKMDNSKLVPNWTKLPEASKACRQLIKCKCSVKGRCKFKCKCKIEKLPCTELCLCKGECDKQTNNSDTEEMDEEEQQNEEIDEGPLDTITIEPMLE